MKKLISVLFFVVFLFGCRKEGDNMEDYSGDCSTSTGYYPSNNIVTITQGVYGTIFFSQGRCFTPNPIPSLSSCQTCPVKRKVRIYEYTLLSNAVRSDTTGSFFKKFNSRLIAEVSANENGFFQVSLQPGTYSMAVVENGELYAKGTDSQGGISPFAVVSGIKQVDFNITYKATF